MAVARNWVAQAEKKNAAVDERRALDVDRDIVRTHESLPRLAALQAIANGRMDQGVMELFAKGEQIELRLPKGVVDQPVKHEWTSGDVELQRRPVAAGEVHESFVEARGEVAFWLERSVLRAVLRAEDVDSASGARKRLAVFARLRSGRVAGRRADGHDLPSSVGAMAKGRERVGDDFLVRHDPEADVPLPALQEVGAQNREERGCLVVGMIDDLLAHAEPPQWRWYSFGMTGTTCVHR